MNRDERLGAILDLLGQAERVQVEEIVEAFGVSPATARRDLDALAERQLVNRTRGGATAHTVAYDLPLRYKREQHAGAKAQIAAAVMDLIPVGARVGLTGGSTCTAIASELGQRADLSATDTAPALTVVTNAVNIAAQLLIRPHLRVVITGGVVQPRSYELIGPYTDLMLNQVNLDLAFVGINGLQPGLGAMVHDDTEAQVNGLMARRADQAWLVADSSKVGVRAFATVDALSDFTGLVTDRTIREEDRRALLDAGLKVLVAG
ncbi:DeoR/GlpR family DNA-binding transcription regulator [Pseudactinotalea sp. Z1739]|uniref:DeoR/GlpR family DNA-binding transcription regulator n=1 Tax=Pseudactinotalea sp. Z1739 TaxID=3413028 RepID=UPI003C7E4CBC